MIDLHCHILPGIDDGAKTIDDSLKLIAAEKRQNVNSIALTPHFNPERTSVEKFCQSRSNSMDILTSSSDFAEYNISVKTGAEVYFSVKLTDIDIQPLCFDGTDYILIELPVNERPYGLTHTLTDIINRGYTPILAHVERYQYFTADPTMLYDMVMKGCLAQVNAGAILGNSNASSMALKYIKWEMAHIVCSDCHSMKHRPPNMKKAFLYIEKKLGKQYTDWLIKNSNDIFNGHYVDMPVIKKPKKILGMWF
ncbi:MAG: tyrosine-protein phosphatase [Acutalibacteraceae bacterium]